MNTNKLRRNTLKLLKRKQIARWLIGILLLAFALFAVVALRHPSDEHLAVKQNAASQPAAITTKLSTNEWKQLESSDGSIKVKYPPGWRVDDGTYSNGNFDMIMSPDFASSTPLPRSREDVTPPSVTKGAVIIVYGTEHKGQIGSFTSAGHVRTYRTTNGVIKQIDTSGFGGQFYTDSQLSIDHKSFRIIMVYPRGKKAVYGDEYNALLLSAKR